MACGCIGQPHGVRREGKVCEYVLPASLSPTYHRVPFRGGQVAPKDGLNFNPLWTVTIVVCQRPNLFVAYAGAPISALEIQRQTSRPARSPALPGRYLESSQGQDAYGSALPIELITAPQSKYPSNHIEGSTP